MNNIDRSPPSIIMLPFAGGSKYSYRQFSQLDNPVHVIEYPGRGGRSHIPLAHDMTNLLSDVFNQVIDLIDRNANYVVYGHSLGGLLGYLLCCELQKSGLHLPKKLVVSGRNSPSVKRVLQEIRTDEEFWDMIIALGGVPSELKDHPDLKEYFVPILKADFKVLDSYSYQKGPTLTIPIDVFYGSNENIDIVELNNWDCETTETVTFTKLHGNHFFIYDHTHFFVNYFKSLAQND